MNITDRVVGIIAPHTCVGCGKLGTVLCGECAYQVQTIPSRCYYCSRTTKDFRTCLSHAARANLFSVHVWGEYSDVLKEVIHKLKYERALQAATNLVDGLSTAHLSLPQFVTIVPVPTTMQRVRQRGYDQAVLLATALSRSLQLPMKELLQRRGTQHQVGSSAQTRRKQLADAFAATRLVPKQVLLVDDVLTTGATLEEAARTLKKAGVKRVYAIVIAQA